LLEVSLDIIYVKALITTANKGGPNADGAKDLLNERKPPIEWRAGTANADNSQTTDTLEQRDKTMLLTYSSAITGLNKIEEEGAM